MELGFNVFFNCNKKQSGLSKYKHIFFDLDHTLWDFAKNSKETLSEAFELFSLASLGINWNEFIHEYWIVNDAFWDDYRKGRVTKEELRYNRFHFTLKHFDVDNFELATSIGDYYVKYSPHKQNVFPNTHETLNYLKSKYKLHIITNGFEEVQYIKLEKSNLAQYFEEVITSENAGVKKPDPKIFNYALELSNAEVQESLMIGDNLEADILGAKEVGIDQVFFNPDGLPNNEEVTFEIQNLKELIGIL